MAKMAIKKVGVGSLGRLVGTWQAVIGVIIGVISAVVASVSVVTNNNFSTGVDVLTSIGIVLAAIIVYPLVMFLIGWVQGAILALIFNFVVSGSGGLEIETTDIKK